jgi:hypothetical protein
MRPWAPQLARELGQFYLCFFGSKPREQQHFGSSAKKFQPGKNLL